MSGTLSNIARSNDRMAPNASLHVEVIADGRGQVQELRDVFGGSAATGGGEGVQKIPAA